MSKTKSRSAGEKLLGRVRRQRLKYVTILPSLVTILNGVCGFWAIILVGTSKHSFAMAGYLILLAMIADMLDGRLARMSKSTSSFGGQLDSLCDMISFGVAPAFLMLKILEPQLGDSAVLNPGLTHLAHRFVWLASMTYMSCAAIRLARFNVENEENESSHMSFMGLPTPAAAGVLVSLIIFHQEVLPEILSHGTLLYVVCENIIICSLPLLTLGTAVLMVSRIRYPHVLNQYVSGKKPFAHFIKVLLFLGLVIWIFRQTALVLIFCGFAASGICRWAYHRILNWRIVVADRKLRPSGTLK